MFRLDNKTAIITGGGSGIGKAIAEIFAGQGAFVYIIDMVEQGAGNVTKAILDKGHRAAFKKCDVSKQAVVKEVIDSIIVEAGTVHILVNNAGISHIGTAESTPEADFDRLLSVNVKGVYNTLHSILPH